MVGTQLLADTLVDRCQLTITWMPYIIEGGYKARLRVSAVNLLAGVCPPSCATPSSPSSSCGAMITMRKSTHGESFLSYTGIGLRLAALWTAGALLQLTWNQSGIRKPSLGRNITSRKPSLAVEYCSKWRQRCSNLETNFTRKTSTLEAETLQGFY